MLVLIWATLLFSVKSNSANSAQSEKPTLRIPPLTEGQWTTLTCTAPSHCSGSDPRFTWMWRGAGDNNYSQLMGNFTTSQGQNSTLTFNPSAKHHSSAVTCKVSCTGAKTTEEMITLNVTYVRKPEITGETTVREGEAIYLTCTVDSFPPSPFITWTKRGLDRDLMNDTGLDFSNDTRTSTLFIDDAKAEDSGQYFCTAEHLNTLTQDVNITVTNEKKPEISGETSVQEGQVLNLTCSVDSMPPPLVAWTKSAFNTSSLSRGFGSATLLVFNVTAEHFGQYICAVYQKNTIVEKVAVTVKKVVKKSRITGSTTVKEGGTLRLTCTAENFAPALITWRKVGSDTNLPKGAQTDLQEDGRSATLIIPSVNVEHSGEYVCTAHQNTTVYAYVTVTGKPKILKSSRCEVQPEILICVCLSHGFPTPTIEWPLMETHSRYILITTVLNHTTFNSTIILPVGDYSATSAVCVSKNENGEIRENLAVKKAEGEAENVKRRTITWLEVIIAFLIGIFLLAITWCLAKICYRKKQRTSSNRAETLEMPTSQVNPLMNAGQAVEDDQIQDRAAAEGAEAAAAGKSDGEYFDGDFSVVKKEGAEKTTETDYAEVKKEKAEGGRALEGKEEEEDGGEDDEMKPCIPKEKEGEDVAVDSSVDLMSQV